MLKQTAVLAFIMLPLMVISALSVREEPATAAKFRKVQAKYIDKKITIDGVPDEVAWQFGDWQGGFYQRNPDDGQPETYNTEFCVLYDETYLYVAARAHDPEPDKIIAILSRRDNYTESDWLYVSIDSYNDNRTAFEFGINAAGVKHDIRRFDDENVDWDWDALWDGDAHINDQGWSAEWRIPFSELRFSSAADMNWGFQVYRELPRINNELSVWSYWSQSEEGFVSNYGNLEGLQNVRASQPLYFSPYFASKAKVSDNLVTEVHAENYDFLYNLGGDFRYSGSNGITLNATLNPDFGQVEADPADYNLSNYETYFPEKRPFFKEGGNIFNFPLGFGDGGMANNSLFYSRRIGRAPQGFAQTDINKDVVTVESPDVTNILGAAKLTGKTDEGMSIGVMEALTSEEQSTIYYQDGSRENSVIEPLSNYFLSRVQQDFNEGQTTVGGIFTAVNRRLDHTGIDYLHRAAYTGGIDLDYEFFNRKYGFLAALAVSNVQGDTTAIQSTQLSSARYYQRPDADHLEYNPQLRSLSGYAFKGIFTKNTGHIRGAVGITGYSPGFEVNDMGYMRSVDNISQFSWLQYYQWESNWIVREYRINLNQWSNYDFSGMRKELGGNINMHFTFQNNWRLGYGFNRNMGGLSPRQNRGGPALYTPKGWNFWAYGNTDQRKDLSSQVFGYYFENDDHVISWELEPGITWRPKQNLQLMAEVGFNQLKDTWSWIGKTEDHNGEMQYFWSDMDQKTLTLTLRADFTLTNNLTIQYYAQPFITAGEYFNYKRVDNARAVDIDKRFEEMQGRMHYNHDSQEYMVDINNDGQTDYQFSGQADFNYKQFRSNLVLRWEYLTGSVFYLVWSQGFTNFECFKPFQFRDNMDTLFRGPSDNVFMVKVSHSLSL